MPVGSKFTALFILIRVPLPSMPFLSRPQCPEVQAFIWFDRILVTCLSHQRSYVVQSYSMPVIHLRFCWVYIICERIGVVEQLVYPPHCMFWADFSAKFLFGVFRRVVDRSIPFFPKVSFNPEDAIGGVVCVFFVL